MCFRVNFEKFLRTPFFIEHFRWLLLYKVIYPDGISDYITKVGFDMIKSFSVSKFLKEV